MKTLFYFVVCMTVVIHGYSQVAINETGNPAATSAILDVNSIDKGILLPRIQLVSTSSNSPIGDDIAASMLVYNSATNNDVTPGFYFWDGTNWCKLTIECNTWGTTGNTGTVSTTNFIGTTDNQPVNIKTNNLEKVRISTKGQIETLNMGNSVFIGESAGENDDLTDNRNVAVGDSALYNNSIGATHNYHSNRNVAIGSQSMFTNTIGDNNTSVGYQTLYKNDDGAFNTAYGAQALFNNSGGYLNNAIGSFSLYSNTSGSKNNAVGFNSLRMNTTGSYNNAFGYYTLLNNTIGEYNIGIGTRSLEANTTGNYNFAVGYYSLGDNTTGDRNIAIGNYALRLNTIKDGLVAIGDSALYYNGTGAQYDYHSMNNTAVGSSSLLNNTTGYNNVGLGTKALYGNTNGSYNVAIGVGTLQYGDQNGFNTAVGAYAAQSSDGGSWNTAIGYSTLINSTTGDNNTACGSKSLYANITGSGNTASGEYSLYNNMTGNSNTAIGGYSLSNNLSGEYNTAIGSLAFFSGASYFNSTALGHNAEPGANNKIVLGNTSITWIGGQVTWSTYSDAKAKESIKHDVVGLEFINKLKPVTYYFNKDKMDNLMGNTDSSDYPQKYNIQTIKQSGFLAQEVEEAAVSSNYDFSGIKEPVGDVGYYSLSYSEFVVPLVKAVQELSQQNKQMNERLDSQQKLIDKQNETISLLIKKLENNE